MLNDGENILHVHDSVVQTEVLAQCRIRERPRLLNALFILFLLSFGHLLNLIMIDSLLGFYVRFLLLLSLN